MSMKVTAILLKMCCNHFWKDEKNHDSFTQTKRDLEMFFHANCIKYLLLRRVDRLFLPVKFGSQKSRLVPSLKHTVMLF